MKCALFIDRRGGLLKCSKKWPIDCFDIKKKIFFSFYYCRLVLDPTQLVDSKSEGFKRVVVQVCCRTIVRSNATRKRIFHK